MGRGGEIGAQHAFVESERVSDVVRAPVLGQEEGGNGGSRGIVGGRGVVFQEVEEGEREHKKWRAPEGGLYQKSEDGTGKGNAEGDAEDEGTQGNGGEGFGVRGRRFAPWRYGIKRYTYGMTICISVCVEGLWGPGIGGAQVTWGRIEIEIRGVETGSHFDGR